MTATTQTTNDEQFENTLHNEEAEEVAGVLVANMTAAEIRAWMSANELTRSRGARKMKSAMQAYEQDPELTSQKAEELEAELGRFHVTCNCGVDERFDEDESAVEAARAHKSENNTHWPKAVDTVNDERLYG